MGTGPAVGDVSTAAAEAARLRRKNEELQVLVAQDLAWERRQEAFFAMNRQFLPHGNGMPSADSIAQFDEAEKDWLAIQREAQRIVKEIRAGLR